MIAKFSIVVLIRYLKTVQEGFRYSTDSAVAESNQLIAECIANSKMAEGLLWTK